MNFTLLSLNMLLYSRLDREPAQMLAESLHSS